MKKYIMNLTVKENIALHQNYSLLKLTPTSGEELPEMHPGQFVQVQVNGSATTFLRRPISVNFVDRADNTLWLLIRRAGEGTAHLMESVPGSVINVMLPLGNGFSLDEAVKPGRTLLVGGGVGVAPLLYFGAKMADLGAKPEFLLGARSEADLLEVELFEKYGKVYISTDDGSAGEHGVVTTNSVFESGDIARVYCCGPMPMMKAVAGVARKIGAECEVSLENMMACGLGACLCCVEKTVKGNVCVCTEGPVFNINQLTW